MTVSTGVQLMSLLLGLLTGGACGALASVMNAVRERLRFGRGLSMLWDLLFWLLSGLTAVWADLRFGEESVRGLQLVTAVCGLVLYVLILGRPTEWAAGLVLKGLGIALSPVLFLGRGLGLYLGAWAGKAHALGGLIRRRLRRRASAGKIRKKIQKNYKKML